MIKVALDIETKSRTTEKEDALNPLKSEITCIGIYGESEDGGKVTKVYRAPWDDFKKEIIDNDNYSFIAHNGKFDFKHLALNLGIRIDPERWVDDTRYMAFVSTEKVDPEWLIEYEAIRKELNKNRKNAHREAQQHSLKTLAPFFLGVDAFWEPDESHDSDEYVLKDCEYTYKLYKVFEEKLTASGQYEFYKNKLMAWSRMILQAEITGIELDVKEVERLQGEYSKRIVELEQELAHNWRIHYEVFMNLKTKELQEEYTMMAQKQIEKNPENEGKILIRYAGLFEKAQMRAISGGDFTLNLNSPAQLIWLLKDRLNYDVTSLKGSESSDKEVLNRLTKQDEDVKKLLDLKTLTKLNTAFFPKYLELKEANTNKIYADFNIDGTRTGRLSSSRPNMQQHPRTLKHLFKAGVGYKFITYDVTAIEPLLMAYYSGDVALTKLIKEGKSLHSVNAIIMFNLDCEENQVKNLYPNERQIAKTIGLACLYGAGWRQVKLACQKEGIFFNEIVCKSIVKRIRDTYSGVWEFKQALDQELEQGAVIYNLLGRPIEFKDPDTVYMKGFNTLIQGSASDLVLDIGLHINKETKAKPVLFVHDSIISIVEESIAEEEDKKIQQLFKRELTNNLETFRLSVEGGIADVWE